MKRDLPEHLAPAPEMEDGPPGSLLASRAFWLGGLFSVVAWGIVIYLIYLAMR